MDTSVTMIANHRLLMNINMSALSQYFYNLEVYMNTTGYENMICPQIFRISVKEVSIYSLLNWFNR